MKFSYSWLKEYIPDLPPKNKVIEALSLYSFEADGSASLTTGDDTIDISLPPNRYSDASGHAGIARELSASLGLKLKEPKTNRIKHLARAWFPVKVLDADLCSRYTAVFVDGISVGQSPQWLRERLASCGVRSINNVVDAMNYVMLETGQPLHAFDADKIGTREHESMKALKHKSKEDKIGIYIRRANKGEIITTLEDKTYELTKDMAVIADNLGPLAIAGIKGGKRAEVDAHTTKIVIESAHFDPASVYKTARALGIRTDASDRFAHGMSPAGTLAAAERAFTILKEIALRQAQGKAPTAVGLMDIGKKKIKTEVIDVDLAWLATFLGENIPEKKCITILKTLGFEISKAKKNALRVTAPAWRIDIAHRADIAEEIARIHGYESLPVKAPSILPAADRNEADAFRESVRDALASLGLSEIYTNSFVSEAEAGITQKPAAALLNPISDNLSHLRATLFTGLARGAEENLRFFESARLFEIGTIFFAPKNERAAMGLMISARKANAHDLFFELKGAVEQLLRRLGVTEYLLEDAAHAPAFLAGGEAARITVDDEAVGFCGVVRTSKHPAAYAEIDIEILRSLVKEEREYEPIRRFPAVERDISLYVDRSTRVADVEKVIYAASAKYVDDVDLIDMYESPDPGEERKSLAFRIIFQAEDRTLADEEVNRETQKIIKALQEELGAEIR